MRRDESLCGPCREKGAGPVCMVYYVDPTGRADRDQVVL